MITGSDASLRRVNEVSRTRRRGTAMDFLISNERVVSSQISGRRDLFNYPSKQKCDSQLCLLDKSRSVQRALLVHNRDRLFDLIETDLV